MEYMGCLTELMNLWFNDDLFQRIYILANTAILVVYGNNAPFVDTDIVYMRLSVIVYLIVHANICLISLFYSLSSHRYRRQMRLWATLIAISSGFWISLAFRKNINSRQNCTCSHKARF